MENYYGTDPGSYRTPVQNSEFPDTLGNGIVKCVYYGVQCQLDL